MPPGILSSTVITVPVLDTILRSPAALNPAYRVQLLSTKIALLTNRPSQPSRGQPFAVELQILYARLDLARTYTSLSPPNAAGAESELGIVEGICKGIVKRMSRVVRQERIDGVEAREAEEAARDDTEESEEDTATAQGGSTISGDSVDRPSKIQARLTIIKELRIEGVKLMGVVQDLSGKPERRGKWDQLALKLEAG